ASTSPGTSTATTPSRIFWRTVRGETGGFCGIFWGGFGLALSSQFAQFAVLGRLAHEVGWKYRDVTEALEEKRKAKAKLRYSRKRKMMVRKAENIPKSTPKKKGRGSKSTLKKGRKKRKPDSPTSGAGRLQNPE
uniref:Uncharacterized protein n=1 Tax=Ficedula albicollis TaxID=59894 RepID=A0A803W1J6_FICAL